MQQLLNPDFRSKKCCVRARLGPCVSDAWCSCHSHPHHTIHPCTSLLYPLARWSGRPQCSQDGRRLRSRTHHQGHPHHHLHSFRPSLSFPDQTLHPSSNLPASCGSSSMVPYHFAAFRFYQLFGAVLGIVAVLQCRSQGGEDVRHVEVCELFSDYNCHLHCRAIRTLRYRVVPLDGLRGLFHDNESGQRCEAREQLARQRRLPRRPLGPALRHPLPILSHNPLPLVHLDLRPTHSHRQNHPNLLARHSPSILPTSFLPLLRTACHPRLCAIPRFNPA